MKINLVESENVRNFAVEFSGGVGFTPECPDPIQAAIIRADKHSSMMNNKNDLKTIMPSANVSWCKTLNGYPKKQTRLLMFPQKQTCLLMLPESKDAWPCFPKSKLA